MRVFEKVICVSAGIFGLMTGGCASAPQSAATLEALPMSSSITLTRSARPPSGLVSFCARNPSMCQKDTGSVFTNSQPGRKAATGTVTKSNTPVLRLTPALVAHLRNINDDVNAAITPASDRSVYGKAEYWSLPLTFGSSRYGDCEEYAMEKRLRLIASGVDSSHLSLGMVTSKRSGRHLVLVVSTDQGDYVLDNMRRSIVGWQDSGYTWISRQSSTDLLSWSYIALSGSTGATGVQ